LIAKKFFVDDVDPAEAVRCGGEARSTGSAIRRVPNDHHDYHHASWPGACPLTNPDPRSDPIQEERQ
jgi:hypothetical protein